MYCASYDYDHKVLLLVSKYSFLFDAVNCVKYVKNES